MCLEIQYQKYIKNSFEEQYRFVKVSPLQTVDLKRNVQYEDADPRKRVAVQRTQSRQRRLRPLQSKRYTDSSVFLLKKQQAEPATFGPPFVGATQTARPQELQMKYTFDQIAWLSREWYSKNKAWPSTR